MKNWVLAAFFLIVGCVVPQLPKFDVTAVFEKDPIHLAVHQVVVESHVPVFDALPHIERKLPKTPAYIIQQWVKHRFRADKPDAAYRLYFDIEKAFVFQTEKASDSWYTLDNINYRLEYKIVLYVLNGSSVVTRRILEGWESKSIPVRSSLLDKEAALVSLFNQMIQKLDAEMYHEIPPEFIRQ